VREQGDSIVFLRRIVPGTADKSYGIHVARLAGMPETIVKRAQNILSNLEENKAIQAELPRARRRPATKTENTHQLDLFEC
jgi:DNA mismatch repair protein MutS